MTQQKIISLKYKNEVTEATYKEACSFQKTNPTKTMRLLKKAAHQGHPNAQHKLSLMYYNRDGNVGEALKWATKAAEQGVADAQFNLGVLLLNNEADASFGGKGNLQMAYQELSKAFKLFQRTNDKESQYECEKILKGLRKILRIP